MGKILWREDAATPSVVVIMPQPMMFLAVFSIRYRVFTSHFSGDDLP
jgi:hypothetical protein